MIQPNFCVEGTQFSLCKNCTSKIDESLLSFDSQLKAFSCACNEAEEFGFLYCAADSVNDRKWNKKVIVGKQSNRIKECYGSLH